MSEHARKSRPEMVPGPLPLDEHHRIGEEAVHFARWFAKSKYHLMGGFLGELTHEPRDHEGLKARFCSTLNHAHRVSQVRGFVTLLLALGVVAAAASSIAAMFEADLQVGLLERAAAVAASVSVVLIAARLLLDRYLERCDVAATFLAIQLAAARRA